MKYVSLPGIVAASPSKEGERNLSFYLAMEEYLARNSSESDLFFMWQTNPVMRKNNMHLVQD